MSLPSTATLGLIDQKTLHRVLRNASHIQEMPEAFMLREGELALSVNFDCSLDHARTQLKKSYGVYCLPTGLVRRLGLTIVPDEPNHANIVGLPSKEVDAARAEYLASQLSRCMTGRLLEKWKEPEKSANAES